MPSVALEEGEISLTFTECVEVYQQGKGKLKLTEQEMFQLQAPYYVERVWNNTGFTPDFREDWEFKRTSSVWLELTNNHKTVRIPEASPRAMLRFSVTDTGIGIEPSATERIFNAFEQAGMGPAAQRGGTGLGLSISRKLVQMMGGALEVHSEVDKGSCFSFVLTFEYAAGEAETKEICDEPEPLINFQGRRVLLAEDNVINREIAQTILEMNGFKVTCAVDGREALEQFCARTAGWFDVILMDIRMPVIAQQKVDFTIFQISIEIAVFR